jgi:protein phosphatase
MIVKVSYLTNFGNYRKTNEDGVLLHDFLVKEKNMFEPGYMVFQDEHLVFCVADGMGGHVNGELASESVLNFIKENLNEFQNKKNILKTIHASKLFLNHIAVSENAYGLGTTLSGISLLKKKGIIFNSGDSRIYKIQNGVVEKLTVDHSLVQALYNSGFIDEEGMRTHPHKNILTSAIIGDLNTEKPHVFLKEINLSIGMQILLCTDGLWESLLTEELVSCLENSAPIEDIAIELIELALEKGGKDNISFILLQIIDL